MPTKTTWVEKLELKYQGKTEKKTVILPGEEAHKELSQHVGIASKLLKPGDASFRNYLAVKFTFITSDRGHKPGGKHKRTKISFNFKIPKQELFNSKDLSLQPQNIFAETGYHTEQVLYEYLKSDKGQKYLLKEFKKAEKAAIVNKELKPIKEGKSRKVYAMITDMHSSMNMCSLETTHQNMNRSCTDATAKEQAPKKENLRSITARSFRKSGYVVSGYERNGAKKEGKIGLKMATRVSSSEIYSKDIKASKEKSIPPAINHSKNKIILSKLIKEPSEELEISDYEKTAKSATILKSSSKTGLKEAFNKYIAQGNSSFRAIRNLILTFPHDMQSLDLLEKAIEDDGLVKKYPNILSRTILNIDEPDLLNALLDAFIRTDNYEKAIKLITKADYLTLSEKHYSERNSKGIPITCYKDQEGYTALWGATESGNKTIFDKMVESAKLTDEEIEKATGYDIDEFVEIFEKLDISKSR